ncbi:hypothetical protein [Salinilacihabitans rarus]|uniref:DUF7855 family protein n=1 Tax=Salinilacihabitans rarus TaxID=2961596 RepID=UPI0020C88F0F|nr:hypothetical protein [Salinilacihabitans rarus]
MKDRLDGAFLVVADSPKARETLRNVCNAYEEAIVRRFGRAVVVEATEFGAFLAFRLREKHGGSVRLRRVRPVEADRPDYRRARDAAAAFEARENESTPYPKFAAGTDYPSPEEMRDRPLGRPKDGERLSPDAD